MKTRTTQSFFTVSEDADPVSGKADFATWGTPVTLVSSWALAYGYLGQLDAEASRASGHLHKEVLRALTPPARGSSSARPRRDATFFPPQLLNTAASSH